MAQQISKSKPLYVVTDKSKKLLSENEASYLKNYRVTFNKNATEAGKEGSNLGMGTPSQANKKYSLITLPAGTNVTMGVYECEETNEIYFANWNSKGLHGWYLIDGATLQPSIIKIDKNLAFSLEPAYKIAAHRVHVTIVYERTSATTRKIKEKYLKYTDGNNWQRFINVIASIRTNGFDAEKFPYFKLRGPQYDATEFIDLPTRPPMFAPTLTEITPQASDIGKPNTIIDKSIQFAYQYINTDARGTTSSPYSNPVTVVSSPCNTSNLGLPRGYNVTLNAGSAFTEKILLFVKFCGGDWELYDTIERFGPMDEALDNQYWLRTNDWDPYNYDAVNNTITYPFYNDRQTGIIDQEDFKRFQTDCPLISIGMSSAGDSILLANNLYGYSNIAKSELAKFKISLVDRDDSSSILQSRKITLYAYLAQNGELNQFIWTYGTDTRRRFGGITYKYGLPELQPFFQPGSATNLGGSFTTITFDPVVNDYFQLTLDPNAGFVAYLAGTDYFAVSTQMFVNADGTMTAEPIISATDNEQKNLVLNLLSRGGYIVQKFEFIVPPGKYIARLAKNGADTSTNYSTTSAPVMGMASKSKIHGYTGVGDPKYVFDNHQLDGLAKELEIDVCNGDFDAWDAPNNNMFYLFVPYVFDTGGIIPNKRWRYIDGYVQEDEVTQIPVEALDYQRGKNGGLIQYYRFGQFTDHNGYFFVYMAEGTAYKGEVIFNGAVNCGPYRQIATTQIDKNTHGDRGFYPAQNVSLKDNMGVYGPCNRVLIKGSIVDKNTGIGFSGIAVTTNRGATAYTDADGLFELPVHGPRSNGKLYINSQGGSGCYLLPENGRCFQILDYNIDGIPCVNCTERVYPTNFKILASVLSQAPRSLKDGGTYPLACHVMDLAGRTNYEQDLGIIDIPTFMEKGGFILSQIKIDLLATLNLPKDSAWLIFSRGQNQRASQYLQWVGDKIEFLDKNGNVTLNGAGAIRARITIQSLLDYNATNNFSTTATYQFVKGQILRFYDNGNGKLFDPKDGGLMDFPILGTDFNSTVEGTVAISKTDSGVTTTTTTPVNNPGNTIIIPFDERLLTLNNISATNNGTQAELNACAFWIEIMTPQPTQQVTGYCEIVGTYPIINNQLSPQSFLLDTFDTWYQTRTIHIPQCSGKAILHPFASAAVSDFFGQNCTSCGRELIKDPLAEQKWYPTDVIKSDELVNEGRVNGLGTFRSSNRKQYKGQQMGGIVAVHAQNKLVAFICENNWFVADYDNNFAQTTKDGLIVAMFNGELGEPDVKVRSKYGCAFEDTGTIIINDIDGYIFFGDAKNEGVIAMDYRTAYDVAGINNKGYFSDKFNYVKQYNQSLVNDPDRLSKYYDKIFGFDYKFKELHVSFRPRMGLKSDPQYFTNTERGTMIPLPETFTYGLASQQWTQFQTFVAEMYGTLRNSLNGQLMIAFAVGTPYLHNDKTVDKYNEFFGISDTQVIEVAFKIPGTDSYRRQIDTPGKDLTFQAVTVESPTIPYFADKITTNNPNTFSYIPQAWFKKKKNIFYASVLRDMASYPDMLHPVKSMLVDGSGKISGEWCVVRFVRDLEQINEYNEVDGFYMQYIGLEKSK